MGVGPAVDMVNDKKIPWHVQSAFFKGGKRDLSNMLAKLDLFNSVDSF